MTSVFMCILNKANESPQSHHLSYLPQFWLQLSLIQVRWLTLPLQNFTFFFFLIGLGKSKKISSVPSDIFFFSTCLIHIQHRSLILVLIWVIQERLYWWFLLQSHVQNDQYLTSYTIEPMVELLWIEEATHKDTRYKVLFPITTPLLSQPLQVIDSESHLVLWLLNLLISSLHSLYLCPTETVPEEQMFKMILGPLGTDVALLNITFPSEVLSVSDCSVRGFNVMEHMSPNSSFKFFTLKVPFIDPVVLQMVRFNSSLVKIILHF